MPELDTYPDAELAVIAILTSLVAVGADWRTSTDVPDDLEKRLPYIRVTCYGGSDDDITDRSRIDVDVFAATKKAAHDLAEQARERLTNGRKPHVGNGFVLDRVQTDTKPHQLPWTANPPPYRYAAAYSSSARR
jgi:hypothetical protein